VATTEQLEQRAKRLAKILLEQNCHLQDFDVAFPERIETELVAKAIREHGHQAEVRDGNRVHVICNPAA
jgi:hypothetical protein